MPMDFKHLFLPCISFKSSVEASYDVLPNALRAKRKLLITVLLTLIILWTVKQVADQYRFNGFWKMLTENLLRVKVEQGSKS